MPHRRYEHGGRLIIGGIVSSLSVRDDLLLRFVLDGVLASLLARAHACSHVRFIARGSEREGVRE